MMRSGTGIRFYSKIFLELHHFEVPWGTSHFVVFEIASNFQPCLNPDNFVINWHREMKLSGLKAVSHVYSEGRLSQNVDFIKFSCFYNNFKTLIVSNVQTV